MPLLVVRPGFCGALAVYDSWSVLPWLPSWRLEGNSPLCGFPVHTHRTLTTLLPTSRNPSLLDPIKCRMVAHHVQALHSGQVEPAETAALAEGIMTWLLQAANQLDGVDNCRALALVKSTRPAQYLCRVVHMCQKGQETVERNALGASGVASHSIFPRVSQLAISCGHSCGTIRRLWPLTRATVSTARHNSVPRSCVIRQWLLS